MIHSIRVYVVAAAQIDPFATAVRDGGLWHHLIRQTVPGWIATDLLQSKTCPTIFVAMDFWSSEQAYLRYRRNPARAVLERFLCKLTTHQIDLGMFSFPPKLYDCEPVTVGFATGDLIGVD